MRKGLQIALMALLAMQPSQERDEFPLIESRRRKARCPQYKGDLVRHDNVDWCPTCRTGVSPEFA